MSDAAVDRARLDVHAEAVLRAWDMVPEGVVRRVAAARVGSAVARCFPAADDDALMVITDVFTWLTAFDDHYERAGVRTSLAVARLVASLERPDGVPHPVGVGSAVAAFAAVRARCRAVLGPEQDDRLADALRGYFLAVLWEQSAPGADTDTFFAMRRHLSFGRVLPVLVEVATGHAVPPGLLRAPSMRVLRDRFADVVALFNDLASAAWETEHAAGPPDAVPANTLALLRAEHPGIGAEEARTRVRAMLAHASAEVELRYEELHRSTTEAGRAHLDGLRDFLAGLLTLRMPDRYATPAR
ncbi:hypothetical protein [Streptomyces sp. NPDC059816]|uniref:terpene synthase family protein n=1 Tax=Streptomyces sp. NPDC059816 TaxID=3346960 RepID=UPI003650962D